MHMILISKEKKAQIAANLCIAMVYDAWCKQATAKVTVTVQCCLLYGMRYS